VLQLVTHRVRAPRRAVIGFVLIGVTTLAALWAGYLGRVSFAPLGSYAFESHSFQSLQQRAPGLRLPLPDTWLYGFDRQAVESQAGRTPSYLFGTLHPEMPLPYFPVALAVKWPLGFLAALALLIAYAFLRRPAARRLLWSLAAGLLFLGMAMFIGRLGIGIRYVLPLVPSCAVAIGALASCRRGDSPHWRTVAFALAAVQAIETAAHAPWHLSFYNSLAGGPARGMWVVNDSNVDWGQGLVALREEMEKRGIARVHLAYHGTVDPAVYGIDSVPYSGGNPGPEADWIAISDYYFVGLSQRMVTRSGRSDQSYQFDFRPLWGREPEARPAGCMVLFRVR
jgi:hypothetical protein